jgi:SAM-dependent methyltransferase
MVATVDFGRTLRLYRHEPLATRLFVRARRLLAPLDAVAAEVPAAGAVLDVGCGHGLFSLALAAADATRRVLGVDPSPAAPARNSPTSRSGGALFRPRSAPASALTRSRFWTCSICCHGRRKKLCWPPAALCFGPAVR